MLLLSACLIRQDVYEERLAYLQDTDGDGYMNVESGGDDCDDSDATIHPDAEEIARDDLDQDCDGADLRDGDGDGAGDDDCDDADAGIYPGATEVPYDTVDQDCDRADLVDVDGDGVDAAEAGGEDCDDADGAVYPGAADACYDGVDADCAGNDDDDCDGDGEAAEAAGGRDCDDGDVLIHPGVPETWDDGFTDNDCDGDVDATTTTFGSDTWFGRTEGANTGGWMVGVGDVDGDGADEWAVSAYYDATAFAYGGAVLIVSGADGGPLAGQRALEAGGANWYAGTALNSVDDRDEDGVREIAVGATGWGGGRGAAFIVPGVTSGGSLEDEATTIYTHDSVAYAGSQVADIGDLDGDGQTEIAVAAPFATVGDFPSAGRVFVFDGTDSGTLSVADASCVWDGDYVNAALGNSVAPAGDQDGDGVPDVLISTAQGVAAWIASGAECGVLRDAAITAVYSDESLSGARMLGDIDGDGARDLAILGDELRVFVDLAARPGLLFEDAYSVFAPGDPVHDAIDLGDLDGDGLSETGVGIPYTDDVGWVALMAGTEWQFGETVTSVARRALSTRRESASGFRLAPVGDVDGDGLQDMAVGAPGDDEGGADAGGAALLVIPQ